MQSNWHLEAVPVFCLKPMSSENEPLDNMSLPQTYIENILEYKFYQI